MTKDELKNKLNKITDFMFPVHSCLCCGSECDTFDGYRICSRCMAKLHKIGNNFCQKCGTHIKGNYPLCIHCKDIERHFNKARSVFVYDENFAPIILKTKLGKAKTPALALGKMLADFFKTSDVMGEVVTFVPMPLSRQKERGFNQAEEICKEFSRLTEIPMIDALEKKETATKQAKLNFDERQLNIIDTFKIKDKNLVKGKHVLLIDDVITTGATVSECAKVMMKAGAKQVDVLSVAHTALNFEE
ncbi:MAG: ComF family protein [Clostridia bacterium]|nr:ComF family protein [Clostridia bacterium]